MGPQHALKHPKPALKTWLLRRRAWKFPSERLLFTAASRRLRVYEEPPHRSRPSGGPWGLDQAESGNLESGTK